MTSANPEAAAIFVSIILVACAVGIVYGVYAAITKPDKAPYVVLTIVSLVVAAFLLN